MINTDVYLIFDRYKTGSIKSYTRTARVVAFRRFHHLLLERELTPKDMALPSSSTKENLIELISSKLCTRYETNKSPKGFVVTSKNPVPEQVQHRVKTKRRDLTSHYEADHIMPQQVHSILKEEVEKSVKVLPSDADVFCSALFPFRKPLNTKRCIYGPIFRWKQANKYQEVSKCQTTYHAISGCFACYFWMWYSPNDVWYWKGEITEGSRKSTTRTHWRGKC